MKQAPRLNLSSSLAKVIPASGWLKDYDRHDLLSDGIAGTIVAIMLVPQAMAYAMLAGLPPEVGLYASVVPLFLYALLGSSRTLAVGPVAIVSLIVAGAVASYDIAHAPFVAAALAFMSGAMLVVAGLLRLGFLVNFISHPVISGFSSGAALIIGVSQLKALLGIDVPGGSLGAQVGHIATGLDAIHMQTLALGVIAIAALVAWPRGFSKSNGSNVRSALARSGPLVVVVFSTAVVWLFGLETAGIDIVGEIPQGLPPFNLPVWDTGLWTDLIETAAVIAIVGYMESVAIAKTLAVRRRQRIEPNQELIGLGVANLGSAVTGGYPVTGGLSRSVVNFNAGARSPMSSVVSALLVLFVAIALTPLLHYLPKATLAAVIVVAVASLIDIRAFRDTWRYDKADTGALFVTVVAVVSAGVEAGLLVGVGVSLALHVYRTSRPHVAFVGRVPGTEHFRNVERHKVETTPGILAVRIDESLYFSNTRFLEDTLTEAVIKHQDVEHVVLVCSAVNAIDSSALETLKDLIEELREVGVTLHLAEVKGPMMDRLVRVAFVDRLAPGRVFLSTQEAVSCLSNLKSD